jgi:hypothetical protein
MKRGIGMKGREERSRGIEIHITDPFVIIKPTAPFKLAKHESRRKLLNYYEQQVKRELKRIHVSGYLSGNEPDVIPLVDPAKCFAK